ncbi:MAG: rhomboid family intramembrane serine protease [Deltaproteobacteria bacterium]|nr:rhomboid family intramembrane serine protease [Deltaproteobacteria bacterium]MCW5802195.1 rhomboid family intramembrane serine protease [Deltaproteobacteria bacterium]
MSKFRVSYNAPVVLTFALLAVAVHCLTYVGGDSVRLWFASWPKLHDARSYVGLVSHILGHANWQHLMGNFMLILLLGPILEERFGSFQLLVMIVLTALITGLIYLVIGTTFLQGASGIVFMMIILASTANIRQGEIPLTFIAVALVYMGGEIVQAVNQGDGDNVAHLAHLIGGTAGGVFGFLGAKAHLLGNKGRSLDLAAAKALDKPQAAKASAGAAKAAASAKKPA